MQLSFSFYALWMLAFLGFPIGGSLARLIGPVNSVPSALLGGLITGAVVGLAQWLVLRQVMVELSPLWIVVTAVGMGVGLAISTALFGIENAGNALLFRAAITGLAIGIAQWLILQSQVANSFWWILVITVSWTIAWFTTRAIGVDLTLLWTVFGSSGAILFQILTAIALRLLIG